MNKFHIFLSYTFQILLWFFIIDVLILRFCFGIGFSSHYERDNYYIQAPYVSYVSEPISKSYLYNRRYKPNESIFKELKENDIKVAFFGGSTGILGAPFLCDLIQEKLSKKLNKKVFVANFSIFSGNSRQHLHMLLEYFQNFHPDIIIFYNGFNEMVEPFGEDPRPGYPYNQFYVEIPEWKKCLIKYSAIFGILEEHYSIITQKEKLKKQVHYLNKDWQEQIIYNYFDTFEKSKNIAITMPSKYFIHPVFIGIFQPFIENTDGLNIYGSDENVIYLTKQIRNNIHNYDYIYDLHDLYNQFDRKEIYDDICHVHGKAHEAMSEEISNIVYNELKKNGLLKKIK